MRKVLFALLGIAVLATACPVKSADLLWDWEGYAGGKGGTTPTTDTTATLTGAATATGVLDTSEWFPLIGHVEYGDDINKVRAIGDSIWVTLCAKATTGSDSVRFKARLQTSQDIAHTILSSDSTVTTGVNTLLIGQVDVRQEASDGYRWVGFGFSPFGVATVLQDSGGVVPGYEQTQARFKTGVPFAKWGRIIWQLNATNAYATDGCTLTKMYIWHFKTR